uniref:Uncharacterized protein n=1 Tax=Tetranychus urticae TaxID=32264 RepID=T1KMU4_TETUR
MIKVETKLLIQRFIVVHNFTEFSFLRLCFSLRNQNFFKFCQFYFCFPFKQLVLPPVSYSKIHIHIDIICVKMERHNDNSDKITFKVEFLGEYHDVVIDWNDDKYQHKGTIIRPGAALVPPWTRVYRVQRDILMPLVSSGVEHGNIRELALARMLVSKKSNTNGGWETFLSYEDVQQDILIGLLRLRNCSPDTFRPELKGFCSIVRELHVYGRFGMLLMEEAQRITLNEYGSTEIAVISGVGTRNYYKKLGYSLEGVYMCKSLI